MASGIRTSVKIEGLEALRRQLRQLPEELQKKALGDAVAKGANLIRDEARVRAPFLTGMLKRSIRSTRSVRRGSEAAAFVGVRRLTKKTLRKLGFKGDAFYWKFLEFGTSKQPAQPFLRPAFDSKKEKAVEVIKQVLADGIAKAVVKLGGRA